MTRPLKYEPSQVAAIHAAMVKRLNRTPTVAEFAKELGVSTRTAWRYMGAKPTRVKCRCCKGTGYVAATK